MFDISSISSKNSIKMIARASDFAWRKRMNAASAGNLSAINCFGKITAIARLLAEFTDGKDQFVVSAGYLYGLLDDTDCSLEEIERRFGREIARVSGEFSVDKTVPKSQRRAMEVRLAAGRSLRGKMVTMAAHIQATQNLAAVEANLQMITRRIERIVWSAEVVSGCRGAHKPLGDAFQKAYTIALNRTSNTLADLHGDDADQLRKELGSAYQFLT